MTSENQDSRTSTLAILERAREGDRASGGRLLERAIPIIRRWAHGRLPSHVRQDANTEDVVQDAVLKVFRQLPRFTHQHEWSLHAYLRRTVVNRMRDLIRGAGRQPMMVEMPPELRDQQPSALELAIRRERRDRFLAALQALPAGDRQLLILRIELGHSAADIGEHLGISTAAAGMRLTRAFEKLRAALDRPSR